MSGLRVGIVDYLNARPLAWGFLTDRGPADWVASYHPPAEVARHLSSGDIDVGLVPSVEALRIDGAQTIPGLCVAATHEVRSVLLLSRVPIEDVRSIALDRNSRTSAALVGVLCRDLWNIAPETAESAPDPEVMLETADAALVIGDPALSIDRSKYRIIDLASAWRKLTGKPFVFAVWAARAGIAVEPIEGTLTASLQLGSAEMPRIITESSKHYGLPEATVREYLTGNLSYRLGHEERSGLDEFYRRVALQRPD